LIEKSIKNCEWLVGAALELAQAHRGAELNIPAGISAAAAVDLNAPAGIPGKRSLVTHKYVI
jgi:hypothetical protein